MDLVIRCILLISLCFGNSLSEDAFNKMIDRSLVKLKNNLSNETENLIVKMPDLTVAVKKNFLWMDLNGVIELDDGVVKTMDGVKKVGNAQLVATNSGDMIITLTLSWNDLTLHYDTFKFKYLFIDIEGGLTVKVKENSVWLNATFEYGVHDSCKMTLNSAMVTSFKGFTSDLQPSKWYKFMNKYIVNYALTDQSNSIEWMINQHLTQNVGDLLNQINLCHYLPY